MSKIGYTEETVKALQSISGGFIERTVFDLREEYDALSRIREVIDGENWEDRVKIAGTMATIARYLLDVRMANFTVAEKLWPAEDEEDDNQVEIEAVTGHRETFHFMP